MPGKGKGRIKRRERMKGEKVGDYSYTNLGVQCP